MYLEGRNECRYLPFKPYFEKVSLGFFSVKQQSKVVWDNNVLSLLYLLHPSLYFFLPSQHLLSSFPVFFSFLKEKLSSVAFCLADAWMQSCCSLLSPAGSKGKA